MAFLKPFCAVRPVSALAPLAAAPPYDVFSRTEAKTYVNTHPDSFLRIDRPETMFPDTADMYAPEVYQKGRETFLKLLSSGAYQKDAAPGYYLYELSTSGHTQTGIVGCTSAKEYESGIIKTHEKTRRDKEEDRIRHIDTLNLQASPIFLTYRNIPELARLIADAKKTQPVYHFTDETNVTHTIWVLDSVHWTEPITEYFTRIPALYVADGHHRAASADAVARKRRVSSQGTPCAGQEHSRPESEYLLSILFPDDELKICPYHRIVSGLNGMTAETFLEKAGEKCIIKPAPAPFIPDEPHEIGMYFHGKWYILKIMEKFLIQDPAEGLDVACLQREILKPLLGITDPRTDPRIRFAGGTLSPADLERAADQTPDGIAFAMYPITMDEFFRVADNACLMPPKSTWFAPKPFSGLLLHEL